MGQLTKFNIRNSKFIFVILYLQTKLTMRPKNQVFHLPSFLQVQEIQSAQKYRFVKKSVITLMDMVKEELGNTLNPKFIINHKKQLQTPHFVIEVTNKCKTWKIIKRLNDFIKLEDELKSKYKKKVIAIPIKKQSQLNEEVQEKMLDFFQIFMNNLNKDKYICEEKCFLKFIEDLVPTERKKMKIFKQIQLSKRAGGRHNQSTVKRILCYFINWSNRFFTITSEGVYYTASDDDFRIQEMIPYSVGFSLIYGQAQTGYTYGIVLKSSHRILSIDAFDIFNMTYFVYALRKAMKQNDYFNKKRYESFANIRQDCSSNYYIDGQGYFSDVLDAFYSAKSEIFITGWMISPYFCLRRPDPDGETRLDRVLETIAKSGIKINIIIYMEPKVALNIDSQFTEDYLTSLSPNIKVLRHPAYVLIPFLWSHHEKMVIIDQKMAFMGGLDIGYGRWDDREHRLNDEKEQFWSGVDYCNYRMTDILKPKNYQTSSINRTFTPRMPWHDIGVRIKGTSVLDLSRHFVQYWNYVNFQLHMNERQLLLYAGINEQMLEDSSEKEYKEKDNPRFSKRFQPSPIKLKRNTSAELTEQKKFNVHDKYTTEIFVGDVDINAHEQEMDFYLQHMNNEKIDTKFNNMIRKLKDKNIFQGRNAINFEQLIVTQKKEDITSEGKQNHQILRSASMWGLGLEEGQEEKSILKAYTQLIFNAQEFIYIENQFFISVQNTIAKAITERINRAYVEKKPFKVIIIIPSLPGFDGQVQKQQAAVLRVQIHHIYDTICRGEKSIVKSLHYIQNLGQYIQFFTLRTHGTIHNIPVSQIIYVHSKLMIVDDKVALIGSANINDRSLMGSRDSEIAVVIEDQKKQNIICKDKSSRQVSSMAHNLRKQLYMEHFGITLSEAEDYLNNDVWWSIAEHAKKNQAIYQTIFGIYPDNKIRTFKDIEKAKKQAEITKYEDLKELIKGNALMFQTKFLKQQNLELKASQKEYFVPSINFT